MVCFTLSYLNWYLFRMCIVFFGQLVARPPPIKAFEGRLCMQGYIQYLRHGMQVSQHSTLAL
jgi:hypothetical protein